MAVTSKDVAKRAGVSHATASRAFSSPELVSKKTLERIMDAARELNYVPNSLASSLKSSQPNTVGYIISNIKNNFFTDIAHKLQKQLYALDMNFMIGLSDENADEEYRCMLSQIAHRASMILFTPSAYSAECERRIKSTRNVRFIQLFRNCYSDVDSLIVKDRLGAAIAVRTLLESGRRRILLLDGESALPTGRREGYLDAFVGAGLVPDERLLATLSLSGDRTQEIARLLDELSPDGIIPVSEFLTAQTVRVLRQRGVAVGRETGVVAYDDSPVAQALGITVVGHDEERIICEIQSMIRRAFEGNEAREHIELDPVLIRRGSE